ncbi:MAG: DUF928 domain-containing protein [Oscillatoria sp. SIO1A7]|nr:DUF928 domain-containing protein [Oscillatoria sp. SIO1A7]
MNWQKSLIKTLGIASISAIATLSGYQVARGVTFAPPPENGTPRSGAGAASRSGQLCGATASAAKTMPSSPTLLLPEGNYGQTLSAHPTILVAVPGTGAGEALFSLKNKEKNVIYTTKVTLSEKAEIIAIKLPEDAPALEVNQTYQWLFAFNCEGSLRPLDPVEGWIERIEADGEQLGAGATINTIEAAASYAAAGIWYDAASVLAHLRKTQPADEAIKQHWQELLGSVGLKDLQGVSLGD